jgi:hypothetical protein
VGVTKNIDLHIEELVLHGFDPRDRHGIADAVQRELARLVGERGLAAVHGPLEIPRLDGGTIQLSGTRAAGAGASIAGAVHSTLATPAADPKR